MKIKIIAYGFFHVLASLGGIIQLLSGPFYFYDTMSYGLVKGWHFEFASGWGFKGVFFLQIIIFGLAMIVPFWLFVTTDSAIRFLPNRKKINWVSGLGLIFFLLAVVAEEQLQKHFP